MISKNVPKDGNDKISDSGSAVDELPSQIDSLSEYTPSELSSEIGTESRGRTKYRTIDIQTIREECRHIIRSKEPINTQEVKRLFQTNKRLIPLYDRFGFLSIKIKMRTERNHALGK